MIKKILFWILFIFVVWKVLSSAQVSFPFLEGVLNKGLQFENSVKTNSVPECAEQMKYQKFDVAAACYKRALANDKLNPELIFFLAYSLYQNKDYNGAIFYTNFITKNFPKSRYALPATRLNAIANNVLNHKTNLQNNDTGDYYNEVKHPSRWVKMPVKVWIQHTDNNANLKNAFYTWQSALYPTVAFEMVNRKEDAEITVVFGAPPDKCSSEDAVGCTLNYNYTKNPSLIGKSEIYLTRFSRYGRRYSDQDIYGILVHEIGHAVGIMGGHSKNQSDVMFPRVDNFTYRPTRRDINTVRKIYSSIKLY